MDFIFGENMDSTNSKVIMVDKSKCITPFTTGYFDISYGLRATLIVIGIIILAVNICANWMAIYTLLKQQYIKRHPSVKLLLFLCFNDCCFALTAETLTAIKIFIPELTCVFDLASLFLQTTLADTSLWLVVLIAVSRYIHTRHLIRVKQIITHTRVNIAVGCVFMISLFLSTCSVIGSSYGNVPVHIVIEICQTLIGVLLIVLTVAIYHQTELIAKKRKTCANHLLYYTAYSEKVLRKIKMSTLLTLLPLRIVFFCSTVVKALILDKNLADVSYWTLFVHFVCHAVYCLTAGTNALIFLFNNKDASALIWMQFGRLLYFIGIRKQGKGFNYCFSIF